MDAVASLFARRFVMLSGKGGVGRTTVAAAMARAAVRAGRRVLLAQMDASDRLSRLLGHPRAIGPAVVPVGPGLDAVNMTARAALLEYGVKTLRSETLARAVFDGKAARGFLGAVPGLDAYAMLGKAWWHTTEERAGRLRYDLVLLDAPASGHAATMLKVPRAILAAMPTGPLARDASALRALFADAAQAAFVIVTRAEDLPARETIELARTVRDALDMSLGPLVVNAMPPPDPAGAPAAAWLAQRSAREPRAGAAADTARDDGVGSGLAARALLAAERRRAAAVLAPLRQDPGLPIVELPRIPAGSLGPAEVDELAGALHSRIAST